MSANKSLEAVKSYLQKLQQLDEAWDRDHAEALAELRKHADVAEKLKAGLTIEQIQQVLESQVNS